MSGIVSRIKENRPLEYISIEHLGVVQNGQEETSNELVKEWAGAVENYTFEESNGTTKLMVDMDVESGCAEVFEASWPKALQRLKELAEE